MRIKGLVSAANRVRDQLKVGVPEQEKTQLKSYIQNTLHTVEKLCQQDSCSPADLPRPSRKAYEFLKQLDLNQLPLRESEVSTHQTIRVANVKKSHHSIQTLLWESVQSGTQASYTLEFLQAQLLQHSTDIENLCEQEGLTPQALEGFSRAHFSWIKFLQKPGYLQAHLRALDILKQEIDHCLSHNSSGVPSQHSEHNAIQLWIEFAPIKALFRHNQKKNILKIHVNEGFIIGQKKLMETLGQQIIYGKSATRTQTIRKFTLSDEFQELLLELELILGEQPGKARGRVYNLEILFSQLNQSYFGGQISKPRLEWSTSLTYRKFGHYSPSRHQIMLSQTLDDETIPEFVTQFVLFHEMLHIKHGAQWKNGKLWVHTPAFKKEERLFPQCDAAEEILNTLAKTP